MPVSSAPLRLDAELTSSARQLAPKMSRSVSEQIAHWARIGRELERSEDVSVEAVRRVLSHADGYDDLSRKEQAIVRARWAERMTQLRDDLRLDLVFRAAGTRYAELNELGSVHVTVPRAHRAGKKRIARSKRL